MLLMIHIIKLFETKFFVYKWISIIFSFFGFRKLSISILFWKIVQITMVMIPSFFF